MGWTRPPRHAWVEQSEADSFDFTTSPLRGTEDLLADPGVIGSEGRDVVYFLQRDCSYMGPATMTSYATTMAREVGTFLAFGAGLTVLGAIAVGITGPGLGAEAGFIATGLVMGTSLLAGLYSGHKNYGVQRAEYPHYGESIPGKLARPDGHLTFFPHGNTETPIRLERYAKADTIPGGEPSAYAFGGHNWAWWDGANPVIKKKLAFD